jgi:hypothetical protein
MRLALALLAVMPLLAQPVGQTSVSFTAATTVTATLPGLPVSVLCWQAPASGTVYQLIESNTVTLDTSVNLATITFTNSQTGFCTFAWATSAAPAVGLSLSGPQTVHAGKTVTLTLSASGTGADTGSSAFQWAISGPAGITATAAPAPALAALGYTVSGTASGGMALLSSMSQPAAIPYGALATIAVRIPRTAPLGGTSITLGNLLGATPAGYGVEAASCPVYWVKVLQPSAGLFRRRKP